MYKILLIEDDEPKRDQILTLLSTEFNHISVSVAKSLNSACRLIDAEYFNLILLDMSLPTFDGGKTVGASGRQKTLGGRDVLRYIVECEIATPVYVVTGFKDFPGENRNIQLEELHKELQIEFPESYRGKVRFSHSSEEWKSRMCAIIRDLLC